MFCLFLSYFLLFIDHNSQSKAILALTLSLQSASSQKTDEGTMCSVSPCRSQNLRSTAQGFSRRLSSEYIDKQNTLRSVCLEDGF